MLRRTGGGVHGGVNWASPDGQFLLRLARLQDVDEVLQVVEVLGPGEPATHGSNHLHGS